MNGLGLVLLGLVVGGAGIWSMRLLVAAAGAGAGYLVAAAGMYETSGDWLLDVGMPGKSGIGGGIVTVSPGKGALGTFSPLLDPAGNSVRGTLVAGHLARRLGLDLLASEAVDPAG